MARGLVGAGAGGQGAHSVDLDLVSTGLALRAWSMRALGSYYSRTLRTTSDQVVIESGPYRVIRHPGYFGSIMV